MQENVQKISSGLFTVASRRDYKITYCVDTTIGRCECPKGVNGSTCWHQFLLWAKFKEASFNFLPVHDPEEKKKLTEIAIGSSLESHFYASIHCFAPAKISTEETNTKPDLYTFREREMEDTNTNCEEVPDAKKSQDRVPKIIESFELFSQSVLNDLKSGNEEFLKSMEKFLVRYDKFSPNQRNSALQSFGTVFVGKSKGRIKVQPTSVSRRVSDIGSRQRQSNNKTKPLPNRRITYKRKRKLAEVVDANVPSAKKAGTTMKSNKKYRGKKTIKKEKKSN